MRASLVSREIIADSVETVMHAERFDATGDAGRMRQVAPRHADGRGPGQLPSVFLYGGSILPGRVGDRPSTSRQRVRGRGCPRRRRPHRRRAQPDRAQRLPDRGLVRRDVHRQHHGVVAEAIGMALPGQLLPAAVDRRRDDSPTPRARPWSTSCVPNIRPRQVMTKDAFENAIAVTMALGGSTNAVLHLLAIATKPGSSWRWTTSTRWPPAFPIWPTPSPTAATTWPISIASAGWRWSWPSCSRPVFCTATA
jgi:dihydroxy-acid dehydratase